MEASRTLAAALQCRNALERFYLPGEQADSSEIHWRDQSFKLVEDACQRNDPEALKEAQRHLEWLSERLTDVQVRSFLFEALSSGERGLVAALKPGPFPAIPAPSVGKVVLSIDHEGELVLAFKPAPSFALAVFEDGSPHGQQIFFGLQKLSFDGRFSKEVGLHREIPHRGKILGGAMYGCNNGELTLFGISSEFGKLNAEALQICLFGQKLQLNVAHPYIDTTPLAEYLKKQFRLSVPVLAEPA